MSNIITAITAAIAVIATMLFFSFLLSWPVMMLWNGCLVGAIDGVKEIDWLQAWGIQFLFNCMFKASFTTTKKS